jgi:hypothetical protein
MMHGTINFKCNIPTVTFVLPNVQSEAERDFLSSQAISKCMSFIIHNCRRRRLGLHRILSIIFVIHALTSIVFRLWKYLMDISETSK